MANRKLKTQVYIVDDSLTIRAMMETLIARDEDLEICGMAANAETALEDIDYYLPDIILLDLALPGMDGLGFLEAIREHWHPMQVIVVSSSAKQGSDVCHKALSSGAIICFDKSKIIAKAREFLALVEQAASGEIDMEQNYSDAVTLQPRDIGDQNQFVTAHY
jgi:two-component system chemotaxis response regulator CheB